MKKLKALIVLLTICTTLSNCQSKEKKEVEQTKETQPKPSIPKPTNEAKLNGQFTFDLTMEDKSNPNKNGRSYIIKKTTVENINLDMTFYGNGKGVGFLDNGENKYMTKKMIDKQKFEYKIQNDTLMFKSTGDKQFNPFAIILDEAINKDYFEIQIIDMSFPVGLYKIGESPKQNN